MKKNVFVVGQDEINIQDLKNIEDAEKYEFIPLLEAEDVRLQLKGEKISYEKLIAKARKKLDNHQGSIDAIISFIDPAMLLTYYLCEQYGLKAPSLESAIYSEHKYLSRKAQKKVLPDHVPPFREVDPFSAPKMDDLDLQTPFWLKPVISYGGQLAFKIENRQDYDESLEIIKNEIDYFSEPYDYLMSISDLPEEMKSDGGKYCIAEDTISGSMYTIEGYVCDRKMEVYAFFESPLYKGTSSFMGYVTPSSLPDPVKERMIKMADKIMTEIAYDNAPFNIEFLYDEKSDHLWVLEVNTRISESHSYPFSKVYGHSNHQFLVQIATGATPAPLEARGPYNIAAKLYYRVFFDDGIVRHIPSPEAVETIEEEFDARIKIQVEKDQKLSDLEGQDSYSYSLADVYLGAKNKKHLFERFDRIVERLSIVVEETEDEI
ncbi:MAG: ATP-grasp domain-containing protein [Cyclonatronaceae bacterium]